MNRITRRDFTKTALATGGLLAAGASGTLAGTGHVIKREIPSSGEAIPIMGFDTNR